MKPDVHHGADGLHHGREALCSRCKRERDEQFKQRWNTSYWKPGESVYDHYNARQTKLSK